MIIWVELDLGHMHSQVSVYLQFRLNLTRLSLGQNLQVTRDLKKDRMKGQGGEEEGKERRNITKEERDCASTHLDAGLIFSHPLTCQNLNVTRNLWGQDTPMKTNTTKG